jgi:hypothetical protein
MYIAIPDEMLGAARVSAYLAAPQSVPHGIELLREYLARIAAGGSSAKVLAFVDAGDGTAATGTVACTQANALVGDTLVLCGITFTVKTTPSANPLDGEFAAITSDTAMGDALAAAINAHPLLKGVCTAASVTGTVTWTMADKGLFGNLGKATETGTSMAVTNPTNGAAGTTSASLRVFRKGL